MKILSVCMLSLFSMSLFAQEIVLPHGGSTTINEITVSCKESKPRYSNRDIGLCFQMANLIANENFKEAVRVAKNEINGYRLAPQYSSYYSGNIHKVVRVSDGKEIVEADTDGIISKRFLKVACTDVLNE